jgi:hypothetical protein
MNLGERSACRGAYQGAAVYKPPFYFDRRLVNRRSLLSFRMRELGKLLAVFGGVITILGLALWSGFGARWLGRLPGDIRIERGNSAFYFPIVTCLIISVVISLILSFFRR